MGAAITDAIIDAANVAIPRSLPNERRPKFKPLYRISPTTLKCGLRPKLGQKKLGKN